MRTLALPKEVEILLNMLSVESKTPVIATVCADSMTPAFPFVTNTKAPQQSMLLNVVQFARHKP